MNQVVTQAVVQAVRTVASGRAASASSVLILREERTSQVEFQRLTSTLYATMDDLVPARQKEKTR